MTLPLNDRVSGPYTATGGETVLDYDFKVMSGADLAVWRRREGVEALLSLSTDYIVDGVGSLDGGNVTLADAALAGDEYVIEGVRPATRISDIVAEQGFKASALNAELDSLQAQIGEIRTRIARSLQRSRFDAAAGDLQLPPHAGDEPRAVVVNADGTADLVTFDTIGEGPATWAIPVDWETGLVCTVGPPSTVVSYDAGSGAELYVCVTSHTAGATFAADAAKWRRIAGDPPDLDVGAMPAAGTVDRVNDRMLIDQGGVNKQVAPRDILPRWLLPVQAPVFAVASTVRASAFGQAASGSIAGTFNRLHMLPFHPGRARTATRLGLVVMVYSFAANARLGIYRNHASDDKPGTLLLDAGTVAIGSIGLKEVTISQALDDELYWLAVVWDTTFGQCAAMTQHSAPIGIDTAAASNTILGLYRNFTYAALPSDESSSSWSFLIQSNAPLLVWK